MNHSFAKILQEELPFLIRVVRGFTRDRERALDLMQDAAVKAWAAKDRFENRSAFRTWLYRIAHNTALNDRRRPSIKDGAGLWYDVNTPEDDTVRQDVGEALSRLTEEKREVLVLYFMGGLTLQEISEKLSLPLGTVAAQFSRAKEAFKKVLTEMGYEYET